MGTMDVLLIVFAFIVGLVVLFALVTVVRDIVKENREVRRTEAERRLIADQKALIERTKLEAEQIEAEKALAKAKAPLAIEAPVAEAPVAAAPIVIEKDDEAIKALADFDERNLFLRGMIPLLGFKSAHVYYDRIERFAGETKYSLKKMLSFAFNGITSFSITPIRLISAFGAIVCLFSLFMAIYAFIQKIAGHTSEGWASLMISIWFFGGVQLLSLGLVGEYIGKIYKEAKHRPRYIIEEYKNNPKE